MAAEMIDGKKISEELLGEVAQEVKAKNLTPKLATILVGDDPASQTYINSKIKACGRCGIISDHHPLPSSATKKELLGLIAKLNKDASVHGILVQVPLPGKLHSDEKELVESVSPEKDVDGYTALNLGKLLQGDESMPSCTPAGVILLLEKSRVKVEGANAVVVGRSITVGRPLAAMLINRNATVTVCHSKTKDLAAATRNADILCVAVGKPKLVTKGMVKPGAAVIDVGINRVEGKLVGDVDFDSVKEVAGKITPVPGGVGPMTVALLMRNTMRACERASRR